jgi:uncharacterized RDD family membrane protein YckC
MHMVSALNVIGSDKSLQDHWVKRIVALIIDYAIFIVLSWLLFWLLFIPWWGNWWGPAYLGYSVFQAGFAGLLLFLYSMIMESSSGGATFGKKAMNLRVMPLSGEMDLGKAAIRNVSKIHGLFLLLDWLVGFVSDGDPKQKWLDRVGGTTVVLTTNLTEQEQHTYQSQQAKYAPPPQEQYQSRHEAAYEYPPKPQPAQVQPAPQQKADAGPECQSCGGRMSETGAGRLKCIRCGRIQ